MSTLKTTHLQHPSSGSPNLTLAADGSVSGGAGLGGLVHIHTEEFTAVSSVSLNDVFSAEYDNYRVVIRHKGGNEDLNLRLRASGVDSTSNYSQNVVDGNGGTLTSGRASTTSMNTGINTNAGVSGVDLSGPYLSAATALSSLCSTSYNGSFVRIVSGINSASTSFDGFTLIPGGAGTISGSVSVYGYA